MPKVNPFVRRASTEKGYFPYEGFEGEPVLLIVARTERAEQLEKIVDDLLGDDWQADSLA